MLHFFSKIRRDLIDNSQTYRYLKYAIGEIALVVIGILIAVQINNWNENKNKKNQLDNIYNVIVKNLNTDLIKIDTIIKFYEELDIKLDSIFTTEYSTIFIDSINEDNYLDCVPCKSNIHSFQTFVVQDKGLELLKMYDENKAMMVDDLSQEIMEFYKINGAIINHILDVVRKESYNNLKYYEQFSWYPDFILGRFNPKTVTFFIQNQAYKNKAASYKMFAVQNYLLDLRKYKEGASIILNKIEKRNIK